MNRRQFIKTTAIGIGALALPAMGREKTYIHKPYSDGIEVTKEAFEGLPNDLYDSNGVAYKELSEASIEDSIIEIMKMKDRSGKLLSLNATHFLTFPPQLS